jgi:hypothetical protein
MERLAHGPDIGLQPKKKGERKIPPPFATAARQVNYLMQTFLSAGSREWQAELRLRVPNLPTPRRLFFDLRLIML